MVATRRWRLDRYRWRSRTIEATTAHQADDTALRSLDERGFALNSAGGFASLLHALEMQSAVAQAESLTVSAVLL